MKANSGHGSSMANTCLHTLNFEDVKLRCMKVNAGHGQHLSPYRELTEMHEGKCWPWVKHGQPLSPYIEL